MGPSVLQALYYADDILKANSKAKIIFKAPRVGAEGKTDIIVKDIAGKVTHAIELKSPDILTSKNLTSNIIFFINQLCSSQPTGKKIVAIELGNSPSKALTSELSQFIQNIKQKNPDVSIHVKFSDE